MILKLPNRVKIQNAVYVCAMIYVVLYKLIATKTKCPRVLLAGDITISYWYLFEGSGYFFHDKMIAPALLIDRGLLPPRKAKHGVGFC